MCDMHYTSYTYQRRKDSFQYGTVRWIEYELLMREWKKNENEITDRTVAFGALIADDMKTIHSASLCWVLFGDIKFLLVLWNRIIIFTNYDSPSFVVIKSEFQFLPRAIDFTIHNSVQLLLTTRYNIEKTITTAHYY
jgi:hypothetical protein